ncbi:MAG: threonylcarbamoyl-AMP synthase, partial [Clostridia bacterium]|nr:threonylcarbamoyl-AMP synthase [Clostridia bacterium]
MQTLLLKSNQIDEAGAILRKGGLVAIPTETVYGLAANALDGISVAKIFEAKGRPQDNPLIVHIADRSQLDGLCTVPEKVLPLMDAFWPGPLTLLFQKLPSVPDAVTAGLPTVAVRMPSHPVAASLLRACGIPVAAPSANASGRPSPTTAAHVLQDLDGKIPLILDGGPC